MIIFMALSLTAFLAFIFGGGQHFLYRWLVVTIGMVAFSCLFLFVTFGETLAGIHAGRELPLTLFLTVVAAVGILKIMQARGNLSRLWTPGE